jgi:S1-C subfamily serine protease
VAVDTSGGPSQMVRRVAAFVEDADRPGLEAAVAELTRDAGIAGAGVGVDDAERIMRLLRRKRYFDLMIDIGEAYLRIGTDDVGLRAQYAQALIDEGMPAAAAALLQASVGEADPVEEAEREGLLGRALKQMYVESPPGHRPQPVVAEAVSRYHRVYAADPDRHLWHGINAAALLALAGREGRPIPGYPDPWTLASVILSRVETLRIDGRETAWDAATAAEACIALGEWEDALRWLRRYVDDPRADAFELASTHRQLEEVWGLDPATSPGSDALALLDAAILTRHEGSRVLAPARSAPEPSDSLQRVLGHDGMVTHRWYLQGVSRGAAVAQVVDHSGRAVGTGFLVDGSELGGPFAGEGLLLVTNAHVVSEEPMGTDVLLPEEAIVRFHGAAEGEEAGVAALLWSSPPNELDTSILRLDRIPAGLEACPLTERRPRLDGVQRVYVIGYPIGGALSYSIDDNQLLDYDERVLHYRAPTEPGSSGSPVFNRTWHVIGVHHAGGTRTRRLTGDGTYAANEGIWVGAIRKRLGGE